MKRKMAIGIFILVLVLCISFLNNIVNFVINIQWYKQVGYLSVYFTKLVAVCKLMIPLFIISFIGIWLYYKSLRVSIIKYRKVVEVKSSKVKIERKIVFFIDLIVSFLASYVFASAYWYRILQFTNSVPFNKKDPILNLDISFYIFKLPLIQSIYSALVSLFILLGLITLLHTLY